MEKLNMWDRMFNRYKTVVVAEYTETWEKTYGQQFLYSGLYGEKIPGSDFSRKVVKYKKIDRLTGSEEIFIKYLD